MPQRHRPETDALYASLDVETRIVVQQRTSEIKTLMRRTAQDIVDIGQKMIEVRARLDYGGFSAWLQLEFEWSRSAAYKFMQVAERFSCANFTQLHVAPSALYLLAAPSTPESACDEALERAAQGERITYNKAQEIVQEHQSAPEAEDHQPEFEPAEIEHDKPSVVGLAPARSFRCVQEIESPAPRANLQSFHRSCDPNGG